MKAHEYLEKGLEINLKDDIASRINTEAALVKFEDKQVVLLEGTKATKLYFVIKGIVRGYYIDEQGNDITKCFSGEHEFFSSEGLRTGIVSSFTIECLEPCFCIAISYELIDELMKADETLAEVFKHYYLREIDKLENKAKNMALLDAKERYMKFCENHPYLHERVDLKYIASYIGIRPASLSRIRKTIKNNAQD